MSDYLAVMLMYKFIQNNRMKLELADILNLEGIEVENYCNLGKELVIDVEMKGVKATCPRCGNISHNGSIPIL